MIRRSTCVLGLALAAACSHGGSTPPPGDSPAPIAFDLAQTIDGFTERYVCELVQMPSSSGDVFIGGGAYTASPNVHHFLLFRTSFSPASPPANLGQPVDCFEGDGVMKYERGYVSGGQARKERAFFPSGFALPFQAGEVLLVQAHLLNATSQPVDASLHVELDPDDPATVTTRVGTLRYYDPYIVVPPRGASTARMRCHVNHDVTILSAGSHMHARGVAYRAFIDAAGKPPSDAPFFTTNDWQAPPLWVGSVDVAGGSSIRFECDYQNPDATQVVQGESATANEMCMFSAFYAPAHDDDDVDCTSMDELGTGTRSCAQTTSCLELCDPNEQPHFETGDPTVGPCWQQCIVDSCPNVAAALLPQLSCTRAKCATECAASGDTCSKCVQANCKTELDACQALDCGP